MHLVIDLVKLEHNEIENKIEDKRTIQLLVLSINQIFNIIFVIYFI